MRIWRTTGSLVLATAFAACPCAAADNPAQGGVSGAKISQMSEDFIDRYLQSMGPPVPAGIAARLVKVSSLFLGMPYGVSPLGEGGAGGPDEDPLWSFDVVDCQTFIEESLAMAVSDSFAGFMANLLAIRYSDQIPSFETRNHLPDLQWIPNNTAKGYIRDITARVGGGETRTLGREIRFDRVELPVSGNKTSILPMRRGSRLSLKYIPYEAAARILDRIPDGTILFVVRVENPRKAFMITHMGIVVVRSDGARFIRHASSHFGGLVSDMLLGVYISTMESYQNWPALGISLYQPAVPAGDSSVTPAR